MVSRERLIEELALLIVEVRELRDENLKMREELEEYRENKSVDVNKKLSLDIIDIDFSVRSINTLHKLNIVTVRDLVSNSEKELYTKGVRGRRTMSEIKLVLSTMGLELGMEL